MTSDNTSHAIPIATRASPLAQIQAQQVADALRQYSHGRMHGVLTPMTTSGDLHSLASNQQSTANKEAFVAEIRQAVLNGSCQLAVHSLKDLPTQPVPGLTTIAITERICPQDAVISQKGRTLADLPEGARVGFSSLRRKTLLHQFRPDLQQVQIRGNIQTRLQKMEQGACDALILAAAGLIRLDLEHRITELLPLQSWLPAPGQAALAVECRDDDPRATQWRTALQHQPSFVCTAAERHFGDYLQADCHAPIGAFAQIISGQIQLRGFVASLEGDLFLEEALTGSMDQSASLGPRLAHILEQKAGVQLQTLWKV